MPHFTVFKTPGVYCDSHFFKQKMLQDWPSDLAGLVSSLYCKAGPTWGACEGLPQNGGIAWGYSQGCQKKTKRSKHSSASKELSWELSRHNCLKKKNHIEDPEELCCCHGDTMTYAVVSRLSLNFRCLKCGGKKGAGDTGIVLPTFYIAKCMPSEKRNPAI